MQPYHFMWYILKIFILIRKIYSYNRAYENIKQIHYQADNHRLPADFFIAARHAVADAIITFCRNGYTTGASGISVCADDFLADAAYF